MLDPKDSDRHAYFMTKAKACELKLREAEEAKRWWTAPYWRGARDSYLFLARNS